MEKELLKEAIDALNSVNGLVVKSEDVNCDFDELLFELNEVYLRMEREPKSIEDYFNEWDKLIKTIDKSSRRIIEINEQYTELSKTVLQEAIEKEVDFKAIYGGNTEKTRKQYVDEQLKTILDEKKENELVKADALRRIEFIKSLMSMQRILIETGVAE